MKVEDLCMPWVRDSESMFFNEESPSSNYRFNDDQSYEKERDCVVRKNDFFFLEDIQASKKTNII